MLPLSETVFFNSKRCLVSLGSARCSSVTTAPGSHWDSAQSSPCSLENSEKKASQRTAGTRHLRCSRLNSMSDLVWSTDSWGAAGGQMCRAPTANHKYAAIFKRQRMVRAKCDRATHAERRLKWPGWIWFNSGDLPWGRRHPCSRVLP